MYMYRYIVSERVETLFKSEMGVYRSLTSSTIGKPHTTQGIGERR